MAMVIDPRLRKQAHPVADSLQTRLTPVLVNIIAIACPSHSRLALMQDVRNTTPETKPRQRFNLRLSRHSEVIQLFGLKFGRHAVLSGIDDQTGQWFLSPSP